MLSRYSCFAELFSEPGLHRLARNGGERQGCLTIGTFSAEAADIPMGLSTAGTVIDRVCMIKWLIAPLKRSHMLR